MGKNNRCQTHVHEFLGTTKIAGQPLHNHRFAGVSGQEIPVPNGHIHAIDVNSDFTIGHLHEISLLTGPQIPVGAGGTYTLLWGSAQKIESTFTTLLSLP